MSDVKIIVEVDTKKGKVAVKEFDKNLDRLEKTAKKSTGSFKNLWLQVGAGIAAFHGIKKSIQGLTKFMGDAVDKAGLQEQVEKDVALALESTGRNVEALTGHFKKYASELQAATVYGDEQILSAQSLLVQLTDLDKRGIDAATRGALGLASVYKTDLKSASTLVAKALAGNYGALSRYGITVDKTMTAEEKRASILKQLAAMYQRAEGETDTYRGAVAQLKNVYGDMKEKVGEAITKNEGIRDLIKDITKAIKDFVESGKIEEWTSAIALHISAIAEEARAVKGFFDEIISTEEDAADESIRQTNVMGQAMALRKDLIKNEMVTVDEWREIFNKHGRSYKRVMRAIANLPEYEQIRNHWEEMKKSAKKETEEIETAFTNLLPTQYKVSQGIEASSGKIVTDWGLIYNATRDQVIPAFQEILPAAGKAKEILAQVPLAMEPIPFVAAETQKTFADLGETQQAFWEDMVLSMEGGIKGVLSTLKRWAIAEAVKWIFAHIPFPASVIAAGGAVATISALYNAIAGMEKGGIVTRETIALVGERGPEAVIPLQQLPSIMNQVTHNHYSSSSSGDRPIHVHAHFILDRREIDEKIIKVVNHASAMGDLKIQLKSIT